MGARRSHAPIIIHCHINIKSAVVGVIRMKSQAEQSLFVTTVIGVRHCEEWRGINRVIRQIKNSDHASILHNEQAFFIPGGMSYINRATQRRGDLLQSHGGGVSEGSGNSQHETDVQQNEQYMTARHDTLSSDPTTSCPLDPSITIHAGRRDEKLRNRSRSLRFA
jgi:hypothetical protein